jgi:bifunctional UDP-N-acetylglucosamine pyrophosphorylase/glucosamine-1-phosphate N-acetyltransferase
MTRTTPSPASAAAPTAAVVLAAGMGTRMKSALPKVMHAIGGRPMLQHVLETLAGEKISPVVVVIGPDMDVAAKAAGQHQCVVQKDRLGTGHAVLQAKNALAAFNGDVLVVYGDTPFIRPETLRKMRDLRQSPGKPDVVVLGFSPPDPGAYGRLIVGAEGLERIVEAKDATPEEAAVGLCNSGIMLGDAGLFWKLLADVRPNNAKGEYYLTDIVGLARKAGLTCAVVEGTEDELLGINSRVELAEAEAIFQRRQRRRAMENGATLTSPETVYFSADTKIGQDVEIGPFVVFGPGVVVDSGVKIKGFCHIEGAHLFAGCIVGPYTRLRPGAEIGKDAHVGNFVEIKNTRLEEGAKVNHLSYVGDARVGPNANVGAGTITANYNGFSKSHTDIGAGASIGSNTVLVAPVKVGAGAMTGAGAVVTRDVPADALAVNSSRQEMREGFAPKYKTLKQAEKDKAKT